MYDEDIRLFGMNEHIDMLNTHAKKLGVVVALPSDFWSLQEIAQHMIIRDAYAVLDELWMGKL